jgi:hypothetical protein
MIRWSQIEDLSVLGGCKLGSASDLVDSSCMREGILSKDAGNENENNDKRID